MLSTRDGIQVCGVNFFLSKFHFENPFEFNGKKPPTLTSFMIFNLVVRRLLRNHLNKLMEHGMNLKIHMHEYGINFLYQDVNLIHGNSFPFIPIPFWEIERDIFIKLCVPNSEKNINRN